MAQRGPEAPTGWTQRAVCWAQSGDKGGFVLRPWSSLTTPTRHPTPTVAPLTLHHTGPGAPDCTGREGQSSLGQQTGVTVPGLQGQGKLWGWGLQWPPLGFGYLAVFNPQSPAAVQETRGAGVSTVGEGQGQEQDLSWGLGGWGVATGSRGAPSSTSHVKSVSSSSGGVLTRGAGFFPRKCRSSGRRAGTMGRQGARPGLLDAGMKVAAGGGGVGGRGGRGGGGGLQGQSHPQWPRSLPFINTSMTRASPEIKPPRLARPSLAPCL